MAYKIEKALDPEEFSTKLCLLRSKESTCDVQIIAGESQTVIWAHKIILASGSEYFSNYFYGKLSENVNEIKINVENIEYEILNEIINYFYSSKIQITDENVRDLLIAADFLQSNWLAKTCKDVMIAHLSKENVFETWSLLEFMRQDGYKQEIINFIIENLPDLSDEPQFLALTWNKVESILLSNVNRQQYEIMFGAFIIWVNFNKTERFDFFIEFIEKMDFLIFDTEFLTNCIRNESLIYESLIPFKIFTNAILDSNRKIDASTSYSESNEDEKLNKYKDCLLYLEIITENKRASDLYSYNAHTGCKVVLPLESKNYWKPYHGAIVRHKEHIYKACSELFLSYNILNKKSAADAFQYAFSTIPVLVQCNQELYIVDRYGLHSYHFGQKVWEVEAYRNYGKPLDPISCTSVSGSRIYIENTGICAIDVRNKEFYRLSNKKLHSFVCFGDNGLYAVEPNDRNLTLFDVRKMCEPASTVIIPFRPLNSPSLASSTGDIYIFDHSANKISVYIHLPGGHVWHEGPPIRGPFDPRISIA